MLDCLRVQGFDPTHSTMGSMATRGYTVVKQLANSDHRRRTASKDILKDEKWYKQGCLARLNYDARLRLRVFSPSGANPDSPILVWLWDEWPVGITWNYLTMRFWFLSSNVPASAI